MSLYALATDHPERRELKRALAEAQNLRCDHRCSDRGEALNCAIADDQPILLALRGECPESRTIIIND